MDGTCRGRDARLVKKSYTLEAGVQRFLDHLRVERGLGANALAVYATGLRVSELVLVRLGDVDFDAGYLRTVGKGREGAARVCR